ncbi:antitoxin Xre/MbcA/ParS toxin-binding domain-containing protein [Paraburkholderia nemoris]|uniref:antitoxin Xre/MbcA/ParS toxin-binding domain-containing protein n=1 Tax=Paraburkholderia nemoris TaxID=2793076 RepID=UPI0038BBAB83
MNDATIQTLVAVALKAQDSSGEQALRTLADACGLLVQVQTMVDDSGNPAGFDASGWTCAWLMQSNPALGGQCPVAYLATRDGRDRIANLLAMAQSGAYG